MQDVLQFGAATLVFAVLFAVVVWLFLNQRLSGPLTTFLGAVLLVIASFCGGLMAFASAYNKTGMQGPAVLIIVVPQAILAALWLLSGWLVFRNFRDERASTLMKVLMAVGLAGCGLLGLVHGLCATAVAL